MLPSKQQLLPREPTAASREDPEHCSDSPHAQEINSLPRITASVISVSGIVVHGSCQNCDSLRFLLFKKNHILMNTKQNYSVGDMEP